MYLPVKPIATKSPRFVVTYDHSPVYFNDTFAKHDWCLAYRVYNFSFNNISQRGLTKSPMTISNNELNKLSDIENDNVRRQVFRLFFAQEPERVETNSVLYAMQTTNGNRSVGKLSASGITKDQDSKLLAQIMTSVFRYEINKRRILSETKVLVKSISGVKLSPVALDKANFIVSWGNGYWLPDGSIQLNYYTTLETMHLFNKRVRKQRKNICTWCRNEGSTIDHIIPISIGGRTVKANVVISCALCNNKIRNLKHLQKFRKWIKFVQNNMNPNVMYHFWSLRYFMNKPRRLVFTNPMGYSIKVKIKRMVGH